MIVCRMPPKPTRVSPLYLAKIAAWFVVESAAVTALAAFVFVTACLIVFDQVTFP